MQEYDPHWARRQPVASVAIRTDLLRTSGPANGGVKPTEVIATLKNADFFAVSADGAYTAAMNHGRLTVWRNGTESPIFEGDMALPDEPDNRLAFSPNWQRIGHLGGIFVWCLQRAASFVNGSATDGRNRDSSPAQNTRRSKQRFARCPKWTPSGRAQTWNYRSL